MNNKRSCKDLSIVINVCKLKVQPWVLTIRSRPGFDSKSRSVRAPSHRLSIPTRLSNLRDRSSIRIDNKRDSSDSRRLVLPKICFFFWGNSRSAGQEICSQQPNIGLYPQSHLHIPISHWILLFHLCLGLPNGLFLKGSLIKILDVALHISPTCYIHLILLDLIL
jgi:hypothetical protein